MPRVVNKTNKFSDLISPRRDINRPIYNWHAFKHSYSKDLVDFFIKEFNLQKGSWVLDPFCGGGTTLLASKQAGLNARGYDILPFSVFLSNVKTDNYAIETLKSTRKAIEAKKVIRNPTISLPDIDIIRKAFTTGVARELIAIKHLINDIGDTTSRSFFNLALLSILESVSNTTKAGGFLRMVERNINPSKVRDSFLKRVDSMIADIVAAPSTPKVIVNASIGDARSLKINRLYDAIITSPPYPNRHDYTRIYALEMIFDFINTNDDLKAIRYKTLRSHVEARKRYNVVGYSQTTELARLIERVDDNGVNNPRVLEMIEGYFEDMFLVLSQMYESLKKKGKIALVVSNVRFAGINIPVDRILAEIGQQVGLKPKGIWIARYRGNSAQQMKEYSRMPSRESIVLWEK